MDIRRDGILTRAECLCVADEQGYYAPGQPDDDPGVDDAPPGLVEPMYQDYQDDDKSRHGPRDDQHPSVRLKIAETEERRQGACPPRRRRTVQV